MFTENKNVGVIGLGIIGSRVAKVLRSKGWGVYVWNRTPKAEPNALGSPAEVARQAKAVQVFVRDGDALLDVIERMVPALTAEHVVMNHATVSPEATRQAADAVRTSGAAFLDCPFTGSRDAAAGGALNYYVGGDEGVLTKVRSLLEESAGSITAVGDIGTATVLKIATNMISASTVAVLSEALAICERGGVDPAGMEAALAVNGCASPLTGMKLPVMLRGDYQTHFSLKNMFKDAQFGLTMADSAGIELPVLSSAAAVMLEQMRAGHGEEDYSVVYEKYRGEA